MQETRLYDSDKNETRSMRSKEEANDYRYFPDPDLLPVEVTADDIERVRAELPELPDQKRDRFMSDYELNTEEAGILTSSRETGDYFEEVVKVTGGKPKICANWVMGELSGALNKSDISITASPVTAKMLGGMIKRIADNTISGKIAKQVFEAMWNGDGDADIIIENKGLKQVTDTGAIEKIIDEILAANTAQAEQYRAGKEKMLGFFVGQVMKQTQGKANPAIVNELLKKKLSS